MACAYTTRKALLVFLSIAFAVSCGGGRPRPKEERLPAPASAPDTTFGPGDLFDVRVYGEKELTNTFSISSNGTIDYPLLGTIKAEGLTPTELAMAIASGLKEGNYLKDPQVSILVKEYKSKKISVFGQVKEPGTFPYQDGMTIVEAISLAGGFTSMARQNETTVIRLVNGKETRFRVPVEEIGQGKAVNFFVMTGDIIFVPERVF